MIVNEQCQQIFLILMSINLKMQHKENDQQNAELVYQNQDSTSGNRTTCDCTILVLENKVYTRLILINK